MGWRKITDKSPSHDWQICRHIGTTKRLILKVAPHVIADFAGKTYDPVSLEYLDDSDDEPVFTIADMKLAFVDGGWNAISFEDFMKRYFNIDL